MELVSWRDEFPWVNGDFFLKKYIYIFFMELVSWRDEFPFLKKFIRSSSLLFPISSLLSPLSYVTKTTIYL